MKPKFKRRFGFGNKKLPKFIATFNITPAKYCPALERGMCKAMVDGKCICYCIQAERQYKVVLPFRMRQMKFWDKCVQKCDVEGFIAAMAYERKLCNIKYLRLDVSGDFRHQADVDFAIHLANALTVIYNIQVYCYTSRHDLDYTHCRPSGLRVIGSGFWKEGMSGTFSLALDDKMIYDDAIICPGDCHKCSICRDMVPFFHVIVKKHGRA